MRRAHRGPQWLNLRSAARCFQPDPPRMHADEYVKLADVEDELWYFRSLHAHVRRELRLRVPATSAVSILDAGCGTGGLIKRLHLESPSWTWSGIDFMPLACELARVRCPGCDIREASVTALPFPDSSFDIVASIDVICQVPFPDESLQALREFKRVLKPGGLLVVNVPAYRWMWSYHDVSCHTRHRYSGCELRRELNGGGFRVERLSHWNALPFPLVFAKRKLFVSPEGSSDVKALPAPAEAALRAAMALEHGWMGLGGNWSWGTSLFAVGRRS